MLLCPGSITFDCFTKSIKKFTICNLHDKNITFSNDELFIRIEYYC